MRQIAIAVLGFSPEFINEISPSQLFDLYRWRIAYDRVLFQRPTYESGRLGGYMAAKAFAGDGISGGPSDVWPFSWEIDAKPNQPELTGDELKQAMKRLDSYARKK